MRILRAYPILLLFAIAACTNDPEVTPPQLVLSVAPADSIMVTLGQPFSFTLTATANGAAVQGADIDVKLPGATGLKTLGKTDLLGQFTFTDSIESIPASGYALYTFVVSKPGSTTSAGVERRVFLRPQLQLQVSHGDTVLVTQGDPLEFKLTATHNADPIGGASITVDKPFGGETMRLFTDTKGETSVFIHTASVIAGSYTFNIVAQKTGYADSDTMRMTVIVNAQQSGPVGLTSLSSHGVGFRWGQIFGAKQLTIRAFDESNRTVATANVGNASVEKFRFEVPVLSGILFFKFELNGQELPTAYRWATAKRLPFETNGQQTVRLWETAAPSSVGSAGLIIEPTGLRVVSTESEDSNKIDLVLASEFMGGPDVFLSLVSPSVTTRSGIIGGKRTAFGNDSYIVEGGLDEDYYTAEISSLIQDGSGGVNAAFIYRYEQSDEVYGDPMIILLRLANEHYARLEVVPQSDGLLYGMNSEGYRYCDVRLSYQEIQGAGYVSRPIARGTEIPRFARRAVRK